MKNFINYKIVSFDLFDTFFLRKIQKPTDIFKLIEYVSKEKNFAKYIIDIWWNKTVIKLIKTKNNFKPIFRKNDITGIEKKEAFNLQKGIKDFFDDFYFLYEKYNLNITKEIATKKLKKLLENSTNIEASRIGDIFHSMDENGKYEPIPIAKPNYSKEFYKQNPDKLKEDLENSFWPIGFLKRLDKKINIKSLEELEKKAVEKIKKSNSVAIFGAAKAAKATYEFLKYYNLESKLKFFVDDFKKGKYFGYDIVTTNELLNKYKEILLVYGRYQKLNPLLESNKKINQIRIYTVI